MAHGRTKPMQPCAFWEGRRRLVLSDQKEIELHSTAAENILIHRNSAFAIDHCRDGYDSTLEEGTLQELPRHLKDEDLQDIWIEGDSADSLEDALFGDDYPRGPIAKLGLLSRDGGIFHVEQDPFSILELTSPASRTPFAHAIFRQECNNGKEDVWPTVVFQQQSNVVYRIPTIADLLSWLQGQSVQFRRFRFPSPVIRLCTSRGRAQHCVAVTECGKAYYWTRNEQTGTVHLTTLQEALAQPAPPESPDENPNVDSHAMTADYLDMPPIDKIAIGLNMGAAATRDGVLYVFSLGRPVNRDIDTPHLKDLDDGTPQHRMSQPFVPQRASINDSVSVHGKAPVFIDVAAGDDHLVALTADGEVFTAGSGFQGALGIGEKQFELDDLDPKSYDWNHESVEYSEDWQEVDVPEAKKVIKIAAGHESTLLLCRIMDGS
ncbi:hypothetical protein LTR37_005782 [Vermiconidia calcicola]|uniref:Uncharacterized protein n=1 Tax=Vermiconidia calcicola TaxID=1690605 RepID=A0ACC3NHT8_9PEZI|nr:hypothetical protein LTR37_005782 [Vermiconidia calcicola]